MGDLDLPAASPQPDQQQLQQPMQEQSNAGPAVLAQPAAPDDGQPHILIPPEPEKQVEVSIGKPVVLALLALVVILVIAYHVYQGISGPQPSALLALLSSKQINATDAESVVFSKINSSATFNISYSGIVTLNGTSTMLANASVSLPITVSFTKYQGASRTYLWAKDVPFFGNFSAIIISLGGRNPTYGCYNISAVYQGIANLTPQGSDYKCIAANNQSGAVINPLNISLNTSTVRNLTIDSTSNSSFDGQPCYLVSASGTMHMYGAPPNNPASVKFLGCMSAAYYVPLNMTVGIEQHGGMNLFLDLEETELGGNVTYQEVSALPGPLVNSTSSLLGTGTNNYSSTASSGNPTFPTLPQNATLSTLFAGKTHIDYATLGALVQQEFNQSPQLNVTYNSAVVSYTTQKGARTRNLTTNGVLGIGKYYDNVSESQRIFLQGSMGLQSASISLNGTSGRYVCSGMLSNAATASNYTCQSVPYSTYTDPMSYLSHYSLTLYPIDEMNITEVANGSVLGYGCTVVNGTGYLGSPTLVSKASFSACISDDYGIPLYLHSIVESDNLTTIVMLNATSLTPSFQKITVQGGA